MCCKMFQMIFVFKSSQGDVDTVTMEHQDPIITALSEQIGYQTVLQAVPDKHTETGQPLMSILREENFLEEEQVARVIAAGNGIEFIDLSTDIVDPIAAHMVTSDFASQHTLIPLTRADNKLRVAISEPLNLVVRDQIEVRTGCKVVPNCRYIGCNQTGRQIPFQRTKCHATGHRLNAVITGCRRAS